MPTADMSKAEVPNTPSNTQPNQPMTANSTSIPLLQALKAATGLYRGEGLNHEGESFQARFLLEAQLDDSLIELRFRAEDTEQAFHEERTWISEDLAQPGLCLWTVSTNTPGVLRLPLVELTQDGSYSTRAVFRLGDPEDMSRFREEITLALRHDGGIEYVYAWAVPHEKFAVRSRCLLRPTTPQ
ncbi:MAG TPA: hypothetical protein PLZ57_06745 [Pseudobdellovibrionaceae bacterium]|nr:hypothetical protein [Pseudobdellovibrionaceae bacterium]